MAQLKRNSIKLMNAERRIASLKSINDKLDLGNGMTIQELEASIQSVREKLETYNTILSTVDAAYNNLLEAEEVLGGLSEKMLMAVAVKYGKNSFEYEMAGGVRRTERKRRIRRTIDSADPELN
ncbi:hypothetical protein BJP34_12300 [Moorena producens PAL-8-15-08-1]|uniref:ATPase involved in DNA repair n=2 Tax=Moorena TaxID=1155738 RepID=A0A1D8TRB0_9CYAN|nr:hypothetical protein BJP34_12300 [Moorena producens PAL-8-15-08-1]